MRDIRTFQRVLASSPAISLGDIDASHLYE